MLYSDSIVALAPFWSWSYCSHQNIPEAITIGNSVFKSIKNKDLSKQKTHTSRIMDDKKTLDEVLVSIFKGLTSYT
jgi:tRNA modification GTPase